MKKYFLSRIINNKIPFPHSAVYVIILFLICCVNYASDNFGYMEHDNILKFKTAGHDFIFNAQGGRYARLQVDGVECILRIEWWKNGILQLDKLQIGTGGVKLQMLLNTQNTKRIEIQLPLSSSSGNPISSSSTNFQLSLTFQIWRDIPTINTECTIIDYSDTKLTKYTFTPSWIILNKNKYSLYETKTKSGVNTGELLPQHNVKHGNTFLLKSASGGSSLGIIDCDNSYIHCLKETVMLQSKSMSYRDISSNCSSSFSKPFSMTFVIFPRNEADIESIASHLKLVKSNAAKIGLIKTDASDIKSKNHLFHEFKTPPKINGDLTDWKDVEAIYLNKKNNIVVHSVYPWGGPKDLSAVLRFGYDSNNLYLACETFDQLFSQNETGENLWLGDCIQIVVDPENNKLSDTSEIPGRDTYDLGFALTPSGPDVYCWKSPNTVNLKNIKYAIKRKNADQKPSETDPTIMINSDVVDQGVVYEIAIPWQMLSPLTPSCGKFGLNIAIMDNDGESLKQFATWVDVTQLVKSLIPQWKNPSLFHELCFENAQESDSDINKWAVAVSKDKEYCLSGENVLINVNYISPQNGTFLLIIKTMSDNQCLQSEVFLLDAKKGFNTLDYCFKAGQLKQGHYRLDISVCDMAKNILAQGIIPDVLVLTSDEIENKFGELKTKRDALRNLIEKTRDVGNDPSFPLVNLSVIDLFIPWTEEEIKHNDLYRANKNIDYLLKMCREAMDEVDSMNCGQELPIHIPKYDLRNLHVRNGFFYSGDVPCFFAGPAIWGPTNILKTMNVKGLGFSFAQSNNALESLWISSFLEKKNRPAADFDSFFNEALDMGIMIEPRLLTEKVIRKKYPEITNVYGNNPKLCVDHPAVREIFDAWLRSNVPAFAKATFLAYSLAIETSYYSADPIYEKMFRDYLFAKYKTVSELNKAWNSRYGSFSEISHPPLEKGFCAGTVTNFPHFQDWCLFSQEAYCNFFRWARDIIREYDKIKPVYAASCISPAGDMQCRYRLSIDFEKLADIDEKMCALDCGMVLEHPKYSCDYWTANFGYDLHHAFDPNKVIEDNEWHGASGLIAYGTPENYDEQKYYNYLRTGLYQAFFRGVSVLALWSLHPKAYFNNKRHIDSEYSHGFAAKPCILHSLGRTCLEIKGLSSLLAKFSQQNAEVAILYSHYSIPNLHNFHSAHESDLMRTYEGTFFLDMKTTFITERQCQNGQLKDFKLLIIPSAKRVQDETFQKIVEFVENGGTALIIGTDSLKYNEYERPRELKPLLANGKSLQLGGTSALMYRLGKGLLYQSLVPLMSAEEINTMVNILLDQTGVCRDVRVVSPQNHSLWGIESRTVPLGRGKYLTYMINLNKEPVTVQLHGREKITSVKNLITNIKMENNPLVLPVSDPVIFEIQM